MYKPPLTQALCLPALDIEALLQGRMIVALSESFRNPAQFLLCPVAPDPDFLPPKACYESDFLSAVSRSAIAHPPSQLQGPYLTACAWAQAGQCRIYNIPYDLEAIAKLTPWSESYLKQLVKMRYRIFLLSLRVHRFQEPVELARPPVDANKIGRYLKLSIPVSTADSAPILDTSSFETRQQQLFDLVPPLHPELEDLQTDLVSIRENSLGAMSLDRDLRYFLGWSCADETYLYDSDLAWIRKISQAGISKSSHEFKRLVHDSLVKLGFSHFAHHPEDSVMPSEVSTPEGNVLFCDAPYPLVSKCKASRHGRIASSVTTRLIRMGNEHLKPQQFEQAVKLIVAAGTLTDLAKQAAEEHQMNVIRPDTLQRLTELQAQHPGCIDLLKLKFCLQEPPFSEAADTKVNQFIDDISQQFALRAALVQAVKETLNQSVEESVSSETIYAACGASNGNTKLMQLTKKQIDELLIELSSPFSGHLGRIQQGHTPSTYTQDGQLKDDRRQNQPISDRFYFLRELHIEKNMLPSSDEPLEPSA